MRKLLALTIVALLLGAADVGAKSVAESRIEQRAAAHGGASAEAEADISSFPFLVRLLLSGDAGDVDLRLSRIAADVLPLSSLDIVLEGVQLNRSRLLSSRDVEIVDIERGRITAVLTAEELQAATRLPVTIEGGEVRVEVRGRAVAVTPALDDDGLRLETDVLAGVSVAVPRTDLLSCRLSEVQVQDDRLLLSCRLDDVPPALLRAAARVS